jgi:hypothetical protein
MLLRSKSFVPLILAFSLLVCCTTDKYILTEPTGLVIEVKGNTYLIASRVLNKGNPGSQLIQWIHEENHGYIKGDTWPRCKH